MSGCLLGAIYTGVRWSSLLARLENVSLAGFVFLLALYAIGQLLSALKWKLFVCSAGLERSTASVVRAYFFGMFVNVFGLGTLGGDVARSLAIRPNPGQRAAAVVSVVADRVHGLLVLLAIGVTSLAILQPAGLTRLAPTLLAGGSLSLVTIIAAWWQGPKLVKRFVSENSQVGRVLLPLADAFPRDGSRLLVASALSLAAHNVQLLMHVVMAAELGAPLTIPELYSTVPFVNIGSCVPVSFMGVGVREALYSVLFSPLGVPLEVSVAFGALWLLVTTHVNALGALAITSEDRRAIAGRASRSSRAWC